MPNVLIVDDDTGLAENLGEIIEGMGLQVTIASSGRAALARAAEQPFDVALVDVRLPDANGNRLLERLRQDSPGTEVLMLTGDATVETAMAAVRGGAFAFVPKPFVPAELVETLRRALDRAALFRERERLQAELERSERRLRAVVDAVPALVVALDDSGKIALWNRRMEAVTGRSRAEMIGEDGAHIVPGEGEHALESRGGVARMVRWRIAEVPGPEGQKPWRYAAGTDITVEAAVLERTRRAERLAAVGQMAAGLAHEVRNPLNAALLQLDVMERRINRGETGAESLHPVAAVVRGEIQRLEHLVGDFLRFAKPQPPKLQTVSLPELCRSVLVLMEPEARAAEVRIRTEIDDGLPPMQADAERLRQVLLNLVRNAVEAMAGGGTLTLRTRLRGADLEIDIEDTGPGFPADAPVFDAFFTTKPKGTGLGLSIVHRIVTDHGGSIGVESHPGCTCFKIVLPFAPDAVA